MTRETQKRHNERLERAAEAARAAVMSNAERDRARFGWKAAPRAELSVAWGLGR